MIKFACVILLGSLWGSLLGSILIPSQAEAFHLATSDESKWSAETVPVDINVSACPSSINLPDDLKLAYEKSWNSIASSLLRLETSVTTTDTVATSGRILVRCSALGATGGGGQTSFSTQNGNIISANVQINADLDWNALGGQEAVAFVLGHELGHAIGFSHSDSEEAMMFFSGIRDAIAKDDIDGATYLYPRSDLTDGPLGCGTITANDGNNGNGLAHFISYLIVLAAMSAFVKSRSKYATQSKNS